MDRGMKASSGTIIAPTDPPPAPAPLMGHASRFWPSPLRRGQADPDLTGTCMPATLFSFVWRMSAWDQVWISAL